MATLCTRLAETIKAVCPLAPGDPVAIGIVGDPATVRFEPAATSTPSQRANAQAVVNAFDWSTAASESYENTQARVAAISHLVDSAASNKLLRALALVLLDEINALRATAVPPLPARTASQVRAAIRDKITSGAAD